MAWNDGLAADGSRIVIERCGISYLDVMHAAGECGTIPAAARRLGVGETTLRTCVARFRLDHWFSPRQEPRCPSKLTRRRLRYWLRLVRDGIMTRRDVAAELGVSYDHLNQRIRLLGLDQGLPSRGAAAWVARRGYRGAASVGRAAGARAWEDGRVVYQNLAQGVPV